MRNDLPIIGLVELIHTTNVQLHNVYKCENTNWNALWTDVYSALLNGKISLMETSRMRLLHLLLKLNQQQVYVLR